MRVFMTVATVLSREYFLNCERILYVVDNACQIYQVIASTKRIDSAEVNSEGAAKINLSDTEIRLELVDRSEPTCRNFR